jgi:predicted transcriptional regulator
MAKTTLDAKVEARVDAADAVALSKIALKQDRSVGAVVRIAIREYLQREGHRK